MKYHFLLIFFYCLILKIVAHRKHFKKSGFRKDMISHLPRRKTKLLDLILNRAVTEIMDNMGDKRKKISSRNESAVNLDMLPNQLQSSLRKMKSKLKTDELILDPFVGQNDPYKNTENIKTEEQFFTNNDKAAHIIDLIQQNGLNNIRLSSRKYVHVNNDNHHYLNDINRVNSLNRANDINRFIDQQKLKNHEVVSSDEEFRKDENSKDDDHIEKKKASQTDDLDTQDQVSEILPSENGDIMLIKDRKNNEEIKLDVPNVYFDAKINSSDSRDKILQNLKNVIKVMSDLKFTTGKYTVKNTSLELGDKRDGAEKLSSNSSLSNEAKKEVMSPISLHNKADSNDESFDRNNTDLASNKKLGNGRTSEIAPEHSKFMYPSHGSYFIQHDGNLYRIEKIQSLHNENKEVEDNKELHSEEIKTKESNWNKLKEKDSMSQTKPVITDQSISHEQPVTNTQPIVDVASSTKHDVEISKAMDVADNSKQESLENKNQQPIVESSVEQSSSEDGQNEQESDNTYEIKHNNKIFRITEITQDKSHILKEHHAPKDITPQSRSTLNNAGITSSSTETPSNTSSTSVETPNENIPDELKPSPVVEGLSNSRPSAVDLSKTSALHTMGPQPSSMNVFSESFTDKIYPVTQQHISDKNDKASLPSALNLNTINTPLQDATTDNSESQNSATTEDNNSNVPCLKNQTAAVTMNDKIQDYFIKQVNPVVEKYNTKLERYGAGTERHDIYTKEQGNTATDDDYVTYVFKTKNNTLSENDITDSLNSTLSEDVTP